MNDALMEMLVAYEEQGGHAVGWPLKSTYSLKASMGHTRAGKQRQNGYK